MITDKEAEEMFDALKRSLGARRALKVTGLTRRGIEAQDVYRCKLSGRAKIGIELMYEKHVQGFDRIEEAQKKYSGKLPDHIEGIKEHIEDTDRQ